MQDLKLTAGPLSLLFQPSNHGMVRHLRVGDTEILRGMMALVRDQNWNTLPTKIDNLDVQYQENGFEITFDAACQGDGIDFRWKARITGEPSGLFRYSFDGEAQSDFLTNRTGFCVLHPATCAGQDLLIEHADKTREKTRFPRDISPHQPHFDIRSLTTEPAPGLQVEVRMEGDVFEMEDQRNWGDASFKTYCTPLRLGTPRTIKAGDRISQSITVRFSNPESGHSRPPSTKANLIEISVDSGDNERPLLPIGFSWSHDTNPLTDRERQRLTALRPSHLRVDIDLGCAATMDSANQGIEEATILGIPLELALRISLSNNTRTLDWLRDFLRNAKRPKLARVLLHGVNGESVTDPQIPALVRELLDRLDRSSVPLACGTAQEFVDFNRAHPSIHQTDGVSFAMNPQVHAFDNLSMLETLDTISLMVNMAEKISHGRNVHVSPITLKRLFNPEAVTSDKRSPESLPPHADPRQATLFGAAWTLGAIAALVRGGAASATFHGIRGWNGVFEQESGSPRPDLFPSIPGGVYPLYHIFAAIGEFSPATVCSLRSSDALAASGIALRSGKRTHLLIANLRDESIRVSVPESGSYASIRILEPNTVETAVHDPESFRTSPPTPLARSERNGIHLTLAPYAIAEIETTTS